MKPLHVTGLMLRIPKLSLKYVHDCFYFTSYLKSAWEGHQCKMESEPKFHGIRLRNDSASKICSFLSKFAHVSPFLLNFVLLLSFLRPLISSNSHYLKSGDHRRCCVLQCQWVFLILTTKGVQLFHRSDWDILWITKSSLAHEGSNSALIN